MCNPYAVAALMAASKASEISATNQQAASAQEASIQNQKIMNQQRAMEAEEETRKAGLELTELERKQRQEQSAALVSAAESGVSGIGVVRQIADTYMQESIAAGTVIDLQETQLAQIGVQSQADYLKIKNEINIAESKKSTGLGAALQIGTAAVSGYAAAGGEFPT